MFGKRFNLDDIERLLSRRFDVSAACYGRDDLLMVAVEHGSYIGPIQATICETFELPRHAVEVRAIKELPRTPNGKLDYARLANSSKPQEVAAAG